MSILKFGTQESLSWKGHLHSLEVAVVLRGEKNGNWNWEATKHKEKFWWRYHSTWEVEGIVENHFIEKAQKSKFSKSYWVQNLNIFTWKPWEFEFYSQMHIRVKKCLKEYKEVSFSLRYVLCQNRWWGRNKCKRLVRFCCCAAVQREWNLKSGNWYIICLSHHLQVESRTEIMRNFVSDIWQLKKNQGFFLWQKESTEGEPHIELGPLTGNNVLTIGQELNQLGLLTSLGFKSFSELGLLKQLELEGHRARDKEGLCIDVHFFRRGELYFYPWRLDCICGRQDSIVNRRK